ncbi:MAG TPA: hypothetical protein VGM44_09600, partial [Polyangiaceae bacterium]
MFFKSWLGSKWAERTRVLVAGGLTLLTLMLVGACTVTTTGGGTLMVNWTIVSTTDPNQCATYGAETISINVTDASGVTTPTRTSCAEFTTAIDGLSAGSYSMTAQLLDASGTPVSTPIGPLLETITDGNTTTQAVDFPADSFGGVIGGGDVLTVDWTVAGGSTPSDCDAAGATSIDIALFDATGAQIGADATPLCTEFQAMITGLDPGAYTLAATLVDEQGNPVTTTVTATVNVTDAGAEQAVDFPVDSFVTPTSGSGV